jgi:thiazole synthase
MTTQQQTTPRESPSAQAIDKPLTLGGKQYRSRLLVGTGKYKSLDETRQALEASGAEIITVALRRIDLKNQTDKDLFSYIEGKYDLLPNTAGCFTKEDALRIARLAAELQIGDLVKLEVLGDQKTLLPDVIATLEATRQLVSEGFRVLPYTNDDPIMAMRLQDAGAVAVMPLGSPIGSGQGILNLNNIRLIREALEVPVIVDAGVGTASDVAIAMELGVDGVLLNSGIAMAQDPIRMARAMRLACEAGREAFLAGRMPKRRYANASSPILDF